MSLLLFIFAPKRSVNESPLDTWALMQTILVLMNSYLANKLEFEQYDQFIAEV